MSLKEYFTYLEDRQAGATHMLVQELLAKFPDKLASHSQYNRVKNKTNMSSEDFAKLIKKIIGPKGTVTIISPKSPDAMSSKYDTFQIKTTGGAVATIILTPFGEPTKGHDFEKELVKKLKKKSAITIDKDAEIILKKMHIDLDDIVDVKQTSTVDTRRSNLFGFDGPKQVGRQIADITVYTSNKEYYISAKAKNATFIYNGKNISFIHVDQKDPKEKIIFDQKFYIDTDMNVKIFKFLGINPKRVVQGLNERIAGATTLSGQWESLALPNKQQLKRLLASAYGYGYWLVQEELSGPVTVSHLNTATDAENLIGNIESCRIKYPYHKSKSTTVQFVATSKYETTRYYVEIRNSKGKLAPLDLRIKKEQKH